MQAFWPVLSIPFVCQLIRLRRARGQASALIKGQDGSVDTYSSANFTLLDPAPGCRILFGFLIGINVIFLKEA